MNKRIETTIGGEVCDGCPFDDCEIGPCVMQRIGVFEGVTDCPNTKQHVQIEISPAAAPTREELITELDRVGALAREAMDKYNDTGEYDRPLGPDYEIEKELMGTKSILTRCKEATSERKQKFEDHLKRSSKIVSTWPEWKQGVLGGVEQTREADHAARV